VSIHPTYYINPKNTSKSSLVGSGNTLELAHFSPVARSSITAVVIDKDGVVYYSESPYDRYIYVIRDFGYEETLFESSIDIYNMVAGDNGLLYCTNGTTVQAVSTVTGTVQWTFTAPQSSSTRVLLVSPLNGDVIFIYTSSSYPILVSLDGQTGAQKWLYGGSGQTQYRAAINNEPAIGTDGTIYLHESCSNSSPYGHNLRAINPDGTHKWTWHVGSPTGGVATSGPIVIDSHGRIYFRGNNQILFSVNPDGTTNFQKWIYSPDLITHPYHALLTDVVDGQDIIYCDDYDWLSDGDSNFQTGTNYLAALYPDGTQKWRWNDLTFVKRLYGGIEIDLNGVLYGKFNRLDDNKQLIYAINPDGTLRNTIEPDALGTSQRIMIGPKDGYILTYGLSELDREYRHVLIHKDPTMLQSVQCKAIPISALRNPQGLPFKLIPMRSVNPL